MLGIENLKKLLKFALDFTKQIAEVTEDKKVQWTELVSFFDEIIQVPALIKGWPDVLSELKDLDPVERQDLYDYFSQHFDLADDKIEHFVEQAVLQALSLIALVELWKATKKQEEQPPLP